MKPLELCLKFNNNISKAILTSALESVLELRTIGLNDPKFIWDNGGDNATNFFDIDYYVNSSGHHVSAEYITNIVITIKMDMIAENLGFAVIDIFNDHIDICTEVNYDPLATIPLVASTEIDEGYIFQLQTQFDTMPFSVHDLKILQQINHSLVDDLED